MSRLVLILLIALLPLRGWAAERMAVYMAASETAVLAMASETQAMPADCPMMVQADSTEKGTGHSDGKRHQGCQSCQLCMSLSTQVTDAPRVLVSRPFTAAIARADRFVSAVLARAVKPPIS